MDIFKPLVSPSVCPCRLGPFGRARRKYLLFLVPLLMLLLALPCSAEWTRSYIGVSLINAIVPLSPDGFVAVESNRVLRLDGHGNIQWAIALQGEGNGLSVEDCAVTPEGDIVLAGTRWDLNGSTCGLIIRLDDTGRPIWTRKLTEIHSSRLERIVVSGEGLIITIGTLDPGSETEALLLAAFAPSGDIEWERSFDSFRSHGFRINLASNGDLLVAGARVFQPIFASNPVNRAFLLRLRPDSTGIWGLYSPGLGDPPDDHFTIPMTVVEEDDEGLLVGLIAGRAGLSGSTAGFWRVLPQGHLKDSWYSPNLETTLGGFARPDSGENPVFFGTFSYPEAGTWIWAGPSLDGGSWARTLLGPLGVAGLWSGCPAKNGDLIFTGFSGQTGSLIWRTSPEGLMPKCGLTEEIPVSTTTYSPELFHGSAELSSLQTGVQEYPLSVESTVIGTSFICGDATAAPSIPTLNPRSLVLLALCFLATGLTILRSSRL